MSKSKVQIPAEPAFVPALILHGLDEAKKPHAAVFAEVDVALAMRAASLMRFVALPVVTDECRQLALNLPRGRIFASGRSFAPFVKKAAHEALVALGGEVPPLPEPPPADPLDAMIAIAAPAASWASLAAGQLVLAPEEDTAGGGWWPALVMELRPEHLAVLRWRDWPDLPAFPRRVADLGLLHGEAVSPSAAADVAPSCAGDSTETSGGDDRSGRDHAPADTTI